VKYLKISELQDALPGKKLPFLKRYPFEPECEFRLLFETPDLAMKSLDIPIPLSCIDRITLSPWLHKKLAAPLKEALWSLPGCISLNIASSTLISNEDWKEAGDAAAWIKVPTKRQRHSPSKKAKR
jgi:hypothetical protein